MRPLYLFDRWGTMVDTVPWPLKALHTDELNGKDVVELSVVGDAVEKDQRIVWRDMYGNWHEHIIMGPDTDHDGSVATDTKCDSCLHELSLIYLDDVRAEGAPDAVMRTLLDGTRFAVGAVEVERSTKKFTWHHVSVREALEDLVEVFGGELLVSVTVSGAAVSGRTVSLLADRGNDNGSLFTYGNNLKGISRRVSEEPVYTRIYPYGAGLPRTDDEGALTGGYTPKISIGDVNGGRDYLDDDAARERYGLPDGRGGKRHSEGKVEFSQCRDKTELKALGLRALEIASKPQASYSGKVVTFEEGGLRGGDRLQVGDTVHVRDVELDERLTTRVLKITRDIMAQMGHPVTTEPEITLGNLLTTITELIASQQGDVDSLQDVTTGLDADVTDLNGRAEDWDSAKDLVDTLPDEWLNRIMDGINGTMNRVGGYVYWEQGKGIYCYDRPKDSNPTMGININGAGFRVGTCKNGVWTWRTFGTPEGFTADLINAGTIQGGSNKLNLSTGAWEFLQGVIRSKDGKSEWNLTNSTFKADSITATGTFACGDTGNGMRLTSDGKLGGYRNGSRVGYIDYLSSVQDASGITRQGLMLCAGSIGIKADAVHVGTQNGSTTRAHDAYNTFTVVRSVTQSTDKTVKVTTGQIHAGFDCGICTTFDVL